jgi:hypothetical protein
MPIASDDALRAFAPLGRLDVGAATLELDMAATLVLDDVDDMLVVDTLVVGMAVCSASKSLN